MNNDGKMIELCKKIRHEQSDMIILLLNLAYIPDSVIADIDFDKGWHERFQKLMTSYKEKFNSASKSKNPENEGLEWKFQDADLEERYGKFMTK